MHKFSSEIIFTGHEILTNGVIITDDDGKILAIENKDLHDDASVRQLDSCICPGFINTHCHLELSHMKDKVDTGTGLLPFLNNVVSFRDIDPDVIMQAIQDGDEEMAKNGIVAVGDISNKLDTAMTKGKSKLDYYTFVEMFDFLQPHMTNPTIAQYIPVMEGQSETNFNRKSFVPHAPYTVSPALFDFINHNNTSGATISIHNQETLAENQLFLSNTGGFKDFYKGFGFSLDHFLSIGETAIHYIIQQLKPDFKTIFVHNTLTTKEDITAASNWNQNIFWATCPNANLYIENKLPNYKYFIDTDASVTLGTDSLTSNWQLSILEEMKTINRFASYVALEKLFQWATLNGAKALSYDDRLGSIEVGKTPGLLAISGIDFNSNSIASTSEVSRLI